MTWFLAARSLVLLTSLPGPAAQRAIGPDAGPGLFERQVAGFAQEAERVDGLFAQFAAFCDAEVAARGERTRDWFGLWDDRIRADLSGELCRDLFDRIVAEGESVKKGMSAAETGARGSVDPGTIRVIRRRYFMDWDGWNLPPPDYPGLGRPVPHGPGLQGPSGREDRSTSVAQRDVALGAGRGA
jgi:hypothetical protein